jgi:hypothetical protein
MQDAEPGQQHQNPDVRRSHLVTFLHQQASGGGGACRDEEASVR